MRLLLIAILTGLSGCATPSPTLLPRLSAPPWPTLPTVSAAEAAPISAEVWRRIALRDRLLRNSLLECYTILEATQP